MLLRRYALSPRSRLESRGARHWLRCDYPLQAVELNDSAARLLAALRPDAPLEQVAAGADAHTVAWLDGLVLRGLLRADYALEPARVLPPVDVVIPAYADADGLARCLAALAAQDYPALAMRVTVADDASPQALEPRVAVPDGLRLRWLRLPRNLGPASARNEGVREPWPDDAPAPWLAFVDADCVPTPGWLRGLAALLESPGVVAAGGAVRGLSRASLLARYEDACSSLYLGAQPGPVGVPGSALSYLPSCNLGVLRGVYERCGGFREGWRFGEDVDLSWRLSGVGHGLFYHPAAEVAHAHRTRLGPFLARRRAYARSEATLRAEHPRRFVSRRNPLALLWLGGLGAALLGAHWPGLALSAAVLFALLLGPAWRARMALVRAEPARWTVRELLVAGVRGLATALLFEGRRLNRQALAAWIPALTLWPVLWPLACGTLVLGTLGEWLARRPPIGAGTFLAGYAADCLAYSLGRAEGTLARAWRQIRPARTQDSAGREA